MNALYPRAFAFAIAVLAVGMFIALVPRTIALAKSRFVRSLLVFLLATFVGIAAFTCYLVSATWMWGE